MRFGYYDDERKEYVITRPDTPLPWINYLGNQDFFGLISNTAGGYTFYKDARLRRLTRYRYNNVPYDLGGRNLYIRDEADGQFWSPNYFPVRAKYDHYECRHGMGYTVLASKVNGIKSSVTYFIPQNENLEVWEVKLSNLRGDKASLSIFSFLEFCLWDALDDATNFQRNFNLAETEVHGNVIYHKTEYRERRNHFAYFACSEDICGYDTQRYDFLGNRNGLDAPQVVVKGKSQDSIAHGWAPVGSHHFRMELEAGETKRFRFLLGYHEQPQDQKFDPAAPGMLNRAEVDKKITQFLKPEVVDKAFDELASFWAEKFQYFQVDTPDIHTNRMVNVWNQYQNMATFNFSRSASYFESGIGRGMGFRDSNQDLLGIFHIEPERARQRILDLAATQLPDGGAYHQYQPLTKKGNDAVGTNFNDDPLWLVLSICGYIKQTGDAGILEELVPYDNQEGTEQSLMHHIKKSLQYTMDRIGPHGLPLIGRADWNDCLNLNTFSETPGESFQTTTSKDGKVAESVFIAGLFVLAAKEMICLCEHIGQQDLIKQYQEEINRISAAVDQAGWDGEWFRRAYNHFGEVIGSKECEEGQIFIEPQGMCVMAGLGVDDGRANEAMLSVRKHLNTPHGIVLHYPGYTSYHLELGEITSYPPGYKENGGVFCHTNPWVMIAEAKLGNYDSAFTYYRQINPSYREAISDIHRSEPYVYAQMIAGKQAATHGEAKNSWLTGTASWNYVAIAEWILGIRPDYNGLIIDPALPSNWEGFKAKKKFRSKIFNITVKRIGQGGSKKWYVNAARVESSLISFDFPEASVDVLVEVGDEPAE